MACRSSAVLRFASEQDTNAMIYLSDTFSGAANFSTFARGVQMSAMFLVLGMRSASNNTSYPALCVSSPTYCKYRLYRDPADARCCGTGKFELRGGSYWKSFENK